MALRFKPNEQFDVTLAFMYDSQVENSFPELRGRCDVNLCGPHGSPGISSNYSRRISAIRCTLTWIWAYNFGFATLHSITWLDRS